ncbi:hypothetical protein GUJ93_ZPchr0008g13145 [Zizania palustris]|uniref:Uncharacterized protein n=1 Tax=Zizania palustris TaxID=103762 RepID=A0A8J5RJG7_ZIZPA|nr:hypothetical protein GUJ93_ZPchr0008g13145 [Zizania palustris]
MSGVGPATTRGTGRGVRAGWGALRRVAPGAGGAGQSSVTPQTGWAARSSATWVLGVDLPAEDLGRWADGGGGDEEAVQWGVDVPVGGRG